MSDAASKSELDDVLSSIRRLVTESSRATSAQVADAPLEAGKAPEPRNHAAEPPAFILGTDWRVEEPAGGEESIAPEPEDELQDEAPKGSIFRVPRKADAAAELSETDLVEQRPVEDEAPAQEQAATARLGDLAKSELERAIAELETLVGDDAQEDATGTGQGAQPSEADTPFDPTEADDMIVDPALVAHHAAQDMPNQVHDAELFAAPALLDEAEPLPDEGSLRDLVAEIVREELQGELGERITRNVRKLVRREIHRAMASKDLI
ncbi:MAG: hypothetical protein ACU0CI_00690 [Shimia sp.]